MRRSTGPTSRVLRLPLLAPEIVEAILDGRHAEGMTLPVLIKGFPVGRGMQRGLLPG